LSPNKLFDVLDAIAVRQTRRFVKRFYLNEKIRRGDAWATITFPQPSVLREDYDLDDVLPGFFQRFAHALGANVEAEDSPLPSPDDFDYGEQLTLARYAPSAYWIGGDSSNMQPAIPKSMRDTAELLTAHRPNDLKDSRWRRLLDTIEAPYDTRTQQMVRKTWSPTGPITPGSPRSTSPSNRPAATASSSGTPSGQRPSS